MFMNCEKNGAARMNSKLVHTALAAILFTAGCAGDTTRDFGIDEGDLTTMKAGIWIDPNGCDHWIIDDGVEGYMTPRLRPDGIPVCRKAPVDDADNTVDFERQLIGSS
jgi:hypothetical protein